MDIRFENGLAAIHTIRQGALVRFNNNYFFIKYFDMADDGRFVLTLENSNETLEVNPKFVEWLAM